MRDHGPILVPLDGSELSEGALPYAAALAAGLGESLVLLTTWEGSDSELAASLPSVVVDLDKRAQEHFGGYLDGVRRKLPSGIKVESFVRSGDASDEILTTADNIGARAIVLATHGRSGISRWVYGSTAGHVLRNASVPVLAVGPHALQRPTAEVKVGHVMVPLDGSALSESALPPAQAIAASMKARLSLVRVVRWAVQSYPYTLPDTYIPQVDEELEKGAKTYLREQEAKVQGTTVDAFVVRGAVADGLIDFVEKEGIDLVVMTTHARKGLARATLGSVADRMLQGNAPVLLIRPDAE